MKTDSWEKAKEIFGDALKLAPADRSRFLKEVCAGDDETRREVESLFDSYDEAESYMENPAVSEVAEFIVAEQNRLASGQCFGHYEIIKQIGTGGMGEVYLAQDKKLDRRVAVKIINEKFAKHESNLNRFIQEAKAASALNHPNILVIHEIGESDDANYIVSEFVEGKTLRETIKQISLKLSEVLDISIQIAGALSAAHAAKIVHRDIKPENIIVRPDGYVKILDFGLAKLVEQKAVGFEDETAKQNETVEGVILGTVNYMSPEQAKGERVDERTDIFSLGAVVYEMIAGRTPFAGDSVSETFANLINAEPQPLSQFVLNVPDELQRIVAKTLRKDKDERYQTINGLLADLKSLRENLAFDERLEKSHPPNDKNATAILQATTGEANKQTDETRHGFSQQIKQHKSFAALALIAFLIGAISYGYYFLSLRKNISSADGKKSIAVLPFVNASQDADAEYFSDGITQNVINNLSQLSGLKVMAKNSVFRYKGKEIELKKVADELGVQTLVMGDIKQVGDKIVINVSLIDPNDGSQIWGEQFVKNSSDVIATQNEIAQSVAQSLRLNLTDAEKQTLAKRPTENAEAYQLYLKGRFFAEPGTPDALNKSIEFYRQAIDKDPNFALAYSDMAMRYMLLGMYFSPPRETMPEAKSYANKALELDNTLSDPHLILGQIALLYEWDWDKAKAELTEGNSVIPQSIETFNCAAHVLQSTGRISEADQSLHRALEADPLSIQLNTELGCNSYYARRYDESIQNYRESLNLEPRNFVALYGLARSLNHQKQYAEAIGEIEKAKVFMPMLPPIAIAEEGYAYAKMGKREEAEKQLKTLDETSKKIFVDPFLMATVYLSLDDKDETFAWLEKAYQAKSSLMPTLVNDVKWDGLRDDARFLDFMNRLGVKSKIG
ncbi:MAG: protein kinase [Acidobacteriota bacterium]|nr:protein kinase [Acidobacteriota bacterium]